MNKSSKNFLFELLNTPSPSGMEKDIQLKWMRYVKKYADKMETDIAGNAIAIINPKAKFKILLAGHCDEIGFIINRIDENGYLYFSNVGGNCFVIQNLPPELTGGALARYSRAPTNMQLTIINEQ